MISRERVVAAAYRRSVDRVPCGEIFIDDGVVGSMFGGGTVGFSERRRFIEHIGLDLVCLTPQSAHASAIEPHLAHPEDVVFPDLSRWSGETDLFIFAMLDGAFGWGTKILGFKDLVCSIARASVDLRTLVRAVEDFNVRVAARAVAEGATGVLIADDIAYNRGPMVDPVALRQHVFPSLARQVAEIKKMGVPVFFHADGNLDLVLDDIVEVGFDGLQGLEKESGMDLKVVGESHGHKLCLWGNLSVDDLVWERDSRALADKVEATIPAFALDGGYIFGTSGGIIKGAIQGNLETVYGQARSMQRRG